MPVTPADAKGLLAGAIADGNPVVFLEHRWLHGIRGQVPAGRHVVPLSAGPESRAAARDVTIAATSYMVLEALLAADVLAEFGCSAEVIDVRVLRPLDDTDYPRQHIPHRGAGHGRHRLEDLAGSARNWSHAPSSSGSTGCAMRRAGWAAPIIRRRAAEG